MEWDKNSLQFVQPACNSVGSPHDNTWSNIQYHQKHSPRQDNPIATDHTKERFSRPPKPVHGV